VLIARGDAPPKRRRRRKTGLRFPKNGQNHDSFAGRGFFRQDVSGSSGSTRKTGICERAAKRYRVLALGSYAQLWTSSGEPDSRSGARGHLHRDSKNTAEQTGRRDAATGRRTRHERQRVHGCAGSVRRKTDTAKPARRNDATLQFSLAVAFGAGKRSGTRASSRIATPTIWPMTSASRWRRRTRTGAGDSG